MQITHIENKTAANGNTYKQVTLADKVYGKDRVNVFSDHIMYADLVPGYDIPSESLEINQKGYLNLKGGTVKKAGAPDNEQLRRIEEYVMTTHKIVLAIAKHHGVNLMGTVGNTNVQYPDNPVDAFTEQEIRDNIPF